MDVIEGLSQLQAIRPLQILHSSVVKHFIRDVAIPLNEDRSVTRCFTKVCIEAQVTINFLVKFIEASKSSLELLVDDLLILRGE